MIDIELIECKTVNVTNTQCMATGVHTHLTFVYDGGGMSQYGCQMPKINFKLSINITRNSKIILQSIIKTMVYFVGKIN